jgi:hypothetical protein
MQRPWRLAAAHRLANVVERSFVVEAGQPALEVCPRHFDHGVQRGGILIDVLTSEHTLAYELIG